MKALAGYTSSNLTTFGHIWSHLVKKFAFGPGKHLMNSKNSLVCLDTR